MIGRRPRSHLFPYTPLFRSHPAEIFAVVELVSAIILPKIIRNKPEDIGEQPDGDAPTQTGSVGGVGAKSESEPELTIGQALRTQAFWCISFGHGFGSMAVLAIMSHLGLLLQDMGHDEIGRAACRERV